MTGIVKFFDPHRGYGFIMPHDGSTDVFVHLTALDGASGLRTGQQVEFELFPQFPKEKPRALRVKLIDKRTYEFTPPRSSGGERKAVANGD